MEEMLSLASLSEEKRFEVMVRLKSLLMRVFSPLSSAVLTDPMYGKLTVQDKATECGLLLSLEESGYSGSKTDVPILIEDWGILGIKGYQAAAKMLLYFNPLEEHAGAKLQMIKRLMTEAKAEGVPFLLEIVLHPLESESEFKQRWHELQVESVQLFSGWCDVLKLEYPGLYAVDDSEAAQQCHDITMAALSTPWIILSRGMEYDRFENSLRISMAEGAKGFAVGRAVWQEMDEVVDKEHVEDSFDRIEHFLYSVAVPRLKKLIEIVEN